MGLCIINNGIKIISIELQSLLVVDNNKFSQQPVSTTLLVSFFSSFALAYFLQGPQFRLILPVKQALQEPRKINSSIISSCTES
jgi:hypothetical protein